MAIIIECNECKTKIHVPDHLAERSSKCRSCGNVFHVPVAQQKVCVSCGVNVAGVKRWKDEAGHYYCHACWNGRTPSLINLEALCPTETSDAILAPCEICGKEYPETHLTKLGQKNLCVSCHIAERKKVEQKKANRAEAKKDLARRAGKKAKSALLFAVLVVIGVVTVMVTIVAITSRNDRLDWQESTAPEPQTSSENHQVE